MKVYVRSPDGRILPHETQDADGLKAALLPGYEIVKSPMGTMLEENGDELKAWLIANGFVRAPAVQPHRPSRAVGQ